ncbi:hypothetical protein CRG98_042098 [Punica granatum]|uniref:CCHC-type domain-containing protein n=1 Tax=Punica granatum TaxID=22663 RepID=A0A2I0I0N4_PUNGR|nr:hypothetical protein CRG98_042098 [Punica granatum]
MSNLNNVYKMVANEERQKIVTRTRESTSDAMVFLAKAKTGHGREVGTSDFQHTLEGKRVCTHCGKMGHLKNSWWALIGYPSWHSKSKTNGGKRLG